MKKSIVIMTSMVFFGFATNALATDFLGYPLADTQLRFYSLILGSIAISVALGAGSCLFSRMTDVKKRAAKTSDKESFGSLVAAAHPAK